MTYFIEHLWFKFAKNVLKVLLNDEPKKLRRFFWKPSSESPWWLWSFPIQHSKASYYSEQICTKEILRASMRICLIYQDFCCDIKFFKSNKTAPFHWAHCILFLVCGNVSFRHRKGVLDCINSWIRNNLTAMMEICYKEGSKEVS